MSTARARKDKGKGKAPLISSEESHSETDETDPFEFEVKSPTPDPKQQPYPPPPPVPNPAAPPATAHRTKPLPPPTSQHRYESSDDDSEASSADSRHHGPVTRNSIWHQPIYGNLVSEIAVPPRILEKVAHAEPPARDEFSHVRYTAVTCGPLDFTSSNYVLRASLFATPRSTEILLSMALYDEDAQMLGRAIEGVLANLTYLCGLGDGTWGKDGWKKVVLVLVTDGAVSFDKSAKALLAGLGVYTEDFMGVRVAGVDTVAHIYEVSVVRRRSYESNSPNWCSIHHRLV